MSKSNIYNKVLLTDKILINFKDVNNNIYNTINNIIKKKVEGLCINEGYVKIDSVKLISYSTGELFSDSTLFNIIYECYVANAVDSMTFDCVVKSITKVGIRAELNEDISPFIIFIARDHHFDNENFSKVSEGDIINVRVIGQRYELNNKFISIIAELLDINNYETSKTQLADIDELKTLSQNSKTIDSKMKSRISKKSLGGSQKKKLSSST
tara:strand:- start:4045 stop:4680 length:636 start_codon:yes stop_codon:yes gene_type:complete